MAKSKPKPPTVHQLDMNENWVCEGVLHRKRNAKDLPTSTLARLVAKETGAWSPHDVTCRTCQSRIKKYPQLWNAIFAHRQLNLNLE